MVNREGSRAQVDLPERTFEFSCRVLKLCQHLDRTPGVNRLLANQLFRSATSVGANVEEAQAGQSRADFVSKMSIACKEARETHYWLRLLATAEIVEQTRLDDLLGESNQLVAILTTIVKKSIENRRR